MLIQGTAEFIQRAKVPAPEDGVHVNGKDGFLKGSHAVILDGKLIPKGRVGMYWQKNETAGAKIFYSLSWKKAQPLKYVKRIFQKWQKLHKIGVSPEPEKIVSVQIDLTYKGEKHKAGAFGIKTEHINAPEKAWVDYMRGIPYDWTGDSHPDHTPEGYLKFVKWAKKTQKEHSVETEGSYKIGDVMWSCTIKRWYLVDID